MASRALQAPSYRCNVAAGIGVISCRDGVCAMGFLQWSIPQSSFPPSFTVVFQLSCSLKRINMSSHRRRVFNVLVEKCMSKMILAKCLPAFLVTKSLAQLAAGYVVGFLLRSPFIRALAYAYDPGIRGGISHHMDVSKNNGTPKWMVKIMVPNPYFLMDDLGEKPPLFLVQHPYTDTGKSDNKYVAARRLSFPGVSPFAT